MMDSDIKEMDIKVWTNNAEAVEASILSGETNEPVLTEYGANEFAVDFLRQIFKDLEKHVDKIKNIMDVIILDRGYWSYDFLEKTLAGKYQVDYVVIAKKSFMFVKEDLRHMIDSQQLSFQERQLFNRTTKTWEPVKVAFVKDLLHGYVSKAQPYQGLVNVVVMKQMEGK